MSSGRSLVAHWDLSTDNPPDLGPRGNRYPGTGADLAGHPNGIAGGICTEFDGDDSVINVGDVVELNAVEKFTIAFWMNQDVLDQQDQLFLKRKDDDNLIQITTAVNGNMYVLLKHGDDSFGYFDYSLVITEGSWHQVTVVFDGTQTGDANRLKVYVDGIPVTLTFSSDPIPSSTADLSGFDAYIGYTSLAFDGELDEFMIFDAALTALQAADLYERTRQGRI